MINVRRSVFIGLGGAGIRAILQVKALLLDHYGHEGELPPCFSFLGVDTDEHALENEARSKTGRKVRLLPHERFFAKVDDPRQYYQTNQERMTWMPKQNVNYLTSMSHGAGTMRSNGRMAFLYNHNKLQMKVTDTLYSVFNPFLQSKWGNIQFAQGPISVHVVFSLCGGTGSGMFLDFSYLLRERTYMINMPNNIHGYGIMPGVFMDESKHPVYAGRLLPNSYAALRELDYLMHLPTADGRGIKMPWMMMETNEHPFDDFVLVDNTCATGLRYHRISDLVEMLTQSLVADIVGEKL